MAIRIFDQSILNAQGALLDMTSLLRQRGGQELMLSDRFSRKGRSLFLRWQTAPGAGLPTEPFKVWRRPAMPLGAHKPVGFEVIAFPPLMQIIQFDEALASASLVVHSASGGTVIIALLCGPPLLDSIVTVQTRTFIGGGVAVMEFQAPLITGLALINVSSFDSVSGMTVAGLQKTESWELVETVGLPVREADWAPLGQQHGVKQGLVGQETDARQAAVDRFARGVNPLGWWSTFPSGAPAPPWEMPDPKGLVEETAIELLPMLRQVASKTPDQQAAEVFQFTIDPPQNPAGVVMPATGPGKADLSPIGLLAMSVATDPMLAVTLGYGTGYPDENIPPIILSDRSLFGDSTHSDWDWLITGLWEKGLDGNSEAVEFAALVPRPPLAVPGPLPADLHVDFQAHLRPAQADQSWLASIRTSWERFPFTQLAAVASFAAARRPTAGAAPADALLTPRALTRGFKPIGNARNDRDPEPTRQSATDGALAIPNAPGSVAMSYAAATQTIFGVWSRWAEGAITVAQPEPALVQVLSADLRPTDTGSGTVCPATLVMEISVDWRVRTVRRVELSGRLFAAASRHAAAPAAAPPAGLQKALGSVIATGQITFAGDTPSLAGGTVECLNTEGSAVVPPGAAQTASRRYRITVPGFSLDYAATPHIGLVLQGRVVERIAPGRVGPWSPTPRLAYASDPRARPTVVVDLVRLASLPDAAGECHAHITWAAAPGAIGYALYESSETRILGSHPGLPQPTPDRTLSQRLTTIKQAFAANPIRRDFIRRNPDLITVTDIDVTLPRGSRDIHLYTVLPVMAGGTEGPWPSGPDADEALIPYAAPKVAVPAPPTLEVQLASDKPPAAPNYRARLRIGARTGAGATTKRIDIYRVRVDDAARRLDSMGPAIASVTATGGAWSVSPAAGGGGIASVTGFDAPNGSWRTVWYRAVAWSEDDPLRAVLKGRSEPSPAVSVLVPPADPPNLSPLTISWPGGDPAAVLVSFTSSAPVAPTPIGPHRLSLQAAVAGGGDLVLATTDLEKVAGSQPATGSGGWRVAGSATEYRLLLRRASVNDAVSVIVRMTDPLGRVTERTASVAAGSVAPLPSLSSIDAFTIAGRGRVFSFSTDAPNTDGSGGANRLRIELVPEPAAPGPLPRPRPTPIPIGPRPPLSLFRLIGGVYVFDGPLASVPTTSGAPAAGVSLLLGRQAAPLDDNFGLFASLKLRSVLVRITLPDGRSVEQRRRG
ncbi:MAG: hypothetical protein KKE02_15330 [Alphaproteobacteria bacterium]|nr:hypothetical protein [Alphaproteobacteria bacterium]MBU1516784.1 hypothetical protein [Alphaproteobacteria bacterium]MBU2092478.1 hypothetical protein [Alphaproteobacteria bacterium]MBU2152391.1 hypothetical protein [Alphaproteobacteria bacterium]MBU2305602.1 hypothetical protein [Alphaproteobacteria bacterium]